MYCILYDMNVIKLSNQPYTHLQYIENLVCCMCYNQQLDIKFPLGSGVNEGVLQNVGDKPLIGSWMS